MPSTPCSRWESRRARTPASRCRHSVSQLSRTDALRARPALTAVAVSSARGRRAKRLALAAFRQYMLVGTFWGRAGRARIAHQNLAATSDARLASAHGSAAASSSCKRPSCCGEERLSSSSRRTRVPNTPGRRTPRMGAHRDRDRRCGSRASHARTGRSLIGTEHTAEGGSHLLAALAAPRVPPSRYQRSADASSAPRSFAWSPLVGRRVR
jgi:hypothetical protein